MEEAVHSPRLVRFGTFEVDLAAGELRKNGVKLKLTGQPFQVLAVLLERPGEVVTREELQKRLWPDTFVDVDHNLNTAINKIREVLGDSAESPRFVETLPRRGYRFVAPLDSADNSAKLPAIATTNTALLRRRMRGAWLLLGALGLLACASFLAYKQLHVSPSPGQRTLTRLTFDDGLQIGATWSPDTRFIAYFADGKLRKLDTNAGPPQVLCDTASNVGGTWNGDGLIVLGNMSGPLQQITLNGGRLRELLRLNAARKEVSQRWPSFLPDGKHFLYASYSSDPAKSGTYLGSVDGREPRRLLDIASNATFVSPGLLVFGRGQVLMAQPFDSGKFQPAGEPYPVADMVRRVEATQISVYSSSPNGTLVYQPDVSASPSPGSAVA